MASGWWAGRIRQFVRHVSGRVSATERDGLAGWLTPSQLALFDAMHPADQRHGLDVVASLRGAGHDDRDLLLAGLFHDAGKGPEVRLWHRVAWSLGERYGSPVLSVVRLLPGFAVALERIRVHPDRSAQLALSAGCSPRVADLVRGRPPERDRPLAEALHLADGAN